MVRIMEQDNELRLERIKKLEAIRALGVDAYGGRFDRTASLKEIVDGFEEGKKASVAGRLTALRLHGKSAFGDVRDLSGRLQIFVKKAEIDDKQYEIFSLLDIGDIVALKGELFKTRTGEITLKVVDIEVMSKSLRPLPEKWHGLKDVELRHRRRYLDLITSEKAREVFQKRSLVISQIRRFLDGRGYLEVETPMMHPIPGGAAGKPFKTHHESLDMDLFLRVAPELYLKRLLVGGFDKVYEINKSFRNEGISTRHNPEFTMLEVYTAYNDVEDVMQLTETLVRDAAEKVFGTLKIGEGPDALDLSQWKRVSFAEIMKKNYGILPEDDPKDWVKKLKAKGVAIQGDNLSRTQIINIVGELLEPGTGLSKKGTPIFVTDYFTELCPLAKKSKKNPYLSDRFELYIGGMEIANGYSELNDPLEQRTRLSDEIREKKEKDPTADFLDEDFIMALEYGMPSAGGLGIGIDRLVMVLSQQTSIREVILFPQMKPQ